MTAAGFLDLFERLRPSLMTSPPIVAMPMSW